ncbi:MAG: sn-glycerol-1-phosphate dehydrogenase, partial [Candidatus Altiarchaeota archaeon]|nr:sn-glycerol-1-phosphate dehydrogenase [Candidatus Altiarchaeota archaeon]
MKNIELPRKVLVGENALYEIDEVVEELGLSGKPLIICDNITRKVAGDVVAAELSAEATSINDSIESHLDEMKKKVSKEGIGYVVGVGGGRIIDAGKVISFETKRPFISVPTTASHDGIASPQASLKRDKPISLQVHCPMGIIADTKIISQSPKRLLAAGCGDAISNYTAVLDWKLAQKEKSEYYGDYASALSMMSATIVMDHSKKIMGNISVLVEALISSGVAIGIAGSSRPCSGSEHMFSHTLDIICEKPALHGEQCGLGTIMMAYLHGADWIRVKDSLRNCSAPTTAKEAGIPEEKI